MNMPNQRVLIVEDDPKTVELVKLYLNRDGYRVLSASDGVSGLKTARESKPSLVILDIMLPGINGLEVCRTIRSESDVPIILLTAKSTDDDKLIGLDSGADDYVTKPFSPRELAARVRVILRRLPSARVPDTLIVGSLTIDFGHHLIKYGEAKVKLTSIETKILGLLAHEPGRIFSRAQIIDEALGSDFEGFDRTVDVHIRNLRRKFSQTSSDADFINTVYGAGYNFIQGGFT
jgi:two-component system, OmpR family, alkaline phosphatase synthesis response regulator PhoP